MDLTPLTPSTAAEIRQRLDSPWERTKSGYTADGGYSRPIWSPAGFLARSERYGLACGCGHREDAPLQELVDAGRGDWPMHRFRWRCRACGSTDRITVEV